ncbi:MAG TPA: nuclear transport factor 2 family protein [Gemmatimonadales bacterium]|jgi:ketosteroid isomerase-like protein|nr:nuclear transport factor 2 family protein [Gemmatimonadales bacterium]
MTKATCLALLALAGCMPPPGSAADAKKAIDAANASWARLTSSGHADSIAEFYAENAVVMPPNMAPTRGKTAIRAFFAELNALKPTLSLRADSVWASGAAAVEQGRYWWKWAGAPPPGMPAADSGKYIVRWVNENGRWLMAQDIWNSDVALPTPAAPAPKPAPARRTTRTRR